jgi:hypothetical protein
MTILVEAAFVSFAGIAVWLATSSLGNAEDI